MTESGFVESVIKDNIGIITFGHPKSNSLPGTVLEQLAKEITQLSSNNAAKVILIQSPGEKTFCAGASFDELQAIDSIEKGVNFFMGFGRAILAIRNSTKFVVARVQGKVVGGGVGLVAACDYAIASNTASIRLSELALGLGPFIIGPAVARKIGASQFNQTAIDADWRSAEWAYDNGLYAQLTNSIIELDQAINKFTTQLANSNPSAMAEIKKVIWQGTEDWDKLLPERAAISAKLTLGDFVQNKIASLRNP